MGHFFITKGNNSYDATHLLYYEDRSFWFTFNFFITNEGDDDLDADKRLHLVSMVGAFCHLLKKMGELFSLLRFFYLEHSFIFF